MMLHQNAQQLPTYVIDNIHKIKAGGPRAFTNPAGRSTIPATPVAAPFIVTALQPLWTMLASLGVSIATWLGISIGVGYAIGDFFEDWGFILLGGVAVFGVGFMVAKW